ncbi:PepSY domain-containing protein [Alteromonas aestuariivivens]|uniref:PepSY domain-containing protein n=1 Tax=Alteromonas aestuariivivens TaxID=1938339 RepID=A0A3D8M7B3_9ALTE|nr:PepSY-associated TM helix domain-containing protein [Alteromonas aestuariivivens]RDV25469.1 PepSY domain-containing protein [Alteromonas aestuariivivens]
MKLRNWSGALHKWLGLILAGWLLLMAVTGSVLLFKVPLLKWQYAQLQLPQPVTPPQSASLLDALPSPLSEGFAYLPTADRPWLEVVTSDKTHWYFNADGPVLTREPHGDLISWLVELHHHLALGDTGKKLLGLLGLASLALIVTGLIRWWPRHQISRRHLAVRWHRPWSKRGLQTLWQLHRSTGVLIWLPITLSLTTGSAIMYAKPVNQTLNRLLPFAGSATPTPDNTPAPALDWQSRFARAQELMPGADIRLVYLDKSRMRLKHPDEWHPNGRNYLAFDAQNGELLELRDVRTTVLGNRLSHTIYPMHVAAIGGAPMLVMVLLAGLALILLPLTGILYFINRKKTGALPH